MAVPQQSVLELGTKMIFTDLLDKHVTSRFPWFKKADETAMFANKAITRTLQLRQSRKLVEDAIHAIGVSGGTYEPTDTHRVGSRSLELFITKAPSGWQMTFRVIGYAAPWSRTVRRIRADMLKLSMELDHVQSITVTPQVNYTEVTAIVTL